jgi:hypothetical protein
LVKIIFIYVFGGAVVLFGFTNALGQDELDSKLQIEQLSISGGLGVSNILSPKVVYYNFDPTYFNLDNSSQFEFSAVFKSNKLRLKIGLGYVLLKHQNELHIAETIRIDPDQSSYLSVPIGVIFNKNRFEFDVSVETSFLIERQQTVNGIITNSTSPFEPGLVSLGKMNLGLNCSVSYLMEIEKFKLGPSVIFGARVAPNYVSILGAFKISYTLN